MPGIGGVEAIRRVRTILDGKQPRILAVTAAAVDSTISEALEAGADAVLSKPVDEQELLAEIARLLELELVFEELPVQDESSPALTPGGAARLVAELPADLQEALHSAAVAADLEQIEALMWKVEGRSSELGAWLKSAAFRYDYPSIIDAIDAIDAINDGREAPC